MGYAAGYLATITVAGVTYSDFASDATLSTTRDALDKTKMGQSRRTYLSGQGDGTLSVSMHLDSSIVAAIEAAYQAVDPVAFTFRPGVLGAADMGQHDGEGIITDRSLPGSADSEWNCNVEIQTTGDIVYTSPI